MGIGGGANGVIGGALHTGGRGVTHWWEGCYTLVGGVLHTGGRGVTHW